MPAPNFTMRELVEAGAHFGHTKKLWNPKMRPFIYGERNGIHIINLDHTAPVLARALEFLTEITAQGGRVLFVGTKQQARETIATTAMESGQYYVNHRWLGGMMTNWQTITNSITKMKKLQKQIADENIGLTKKELVGLTRQKERLELVLAGIGEMGSLPDALFVIDIKKEATAIAEAQLLKIPVIAIIDTNCNPEGIDYPIYGNDDSLRAIKLYCRLVKEAILQGVQNQMSQMGMDIGADAAPDVKDDVKKIDALDTKADNTGKADKADKKPASDAKPAKDAEKLDAKKAYPEKADKAKAPAPAPDKKAEAKPAKDTDKAKATPEKSAEAKSATAKQTEKPADKPAKKDAKES